MAMLLSSLLKERWNCAVDWASTLAEAEAFINKPGNKYLVALCDLNLPDAPHGEVIDLMNRAGVPSVALTAAFGNELRETVLAKGVVDYVLKDSINAYTYVCDLVGRLARNALIKVLVIDDALSIRALLKQALEKYGLQVLVAGDGQEGLDTLKANPDIKLVLVDNNMPVMDGFTFTVEARKLFSKETLAIIGISSTSTPMLSARFLKNGANDFIYKPFHYEEVVSRVNQNLEILELLEASHNAANLDFLTNIYNRRYFFLQGEQQLAKAVKTSEFVCGVMLDIDHFKRVNDTYGHDAGDLVIKRIAELFDEVFEAYLVARLGGEEFAGLCIGATFSQIEKLLERLRGRIEQEVIEFQDQSLKVTISAGMYQWNDRIPDLDHLMAAADQNLYKAKESGRNRVICG